MRAFIGTVIIVVLISACTPQQLTEYGALHFPPHARDTARCIIKRESGGNANAISPTRDYGLFQINRAAHKAQFERLFGPPFERKALDPDLNSRYARYLYDRVGWSPWRGGQYRCF